jgi:hypothetical protein
VATVTAKSLDQQSDWLWTADSAADGSFALDLPAGQYEFAGFAGGYISPQDVTVVAGGTVQVVLNVVVP